MATHVSEYDMRQLKLMLDQLSYFEKDKMDLGELVSRLEGLLHALENVNNEWKEEFNEQWGNLEVIYADALFHESDSVGKESKIDDITLNMKTLIHALVDSECEITCEIDY